MQLDQGKCRNENTLGGRGEGKISHSISKDKGLLGAEVYGKKLDLRQDDKEVHKIARIGPILNRDLPMVNYVKDHQLRREGSGIVGKTLWYQFIKTKKMPKIAQIIRG